MPAHPRNHPSRRKRRAAVKAPNYKLTYGLLALLALSLVVSLGIIAAHLVAPPAPDRIELAGSRPSE